MRRRISEDLSPEAPKKKYMRANNSLPDSLRVGEVLTDINKKQWRIGKSIGAGGFGEIYLASDNIKEPVKSDTGYVAKVERHDNGPLFVEINCYLRAARLDMIYQWISEKNITEIGMPHYIASGSHSTSSERYRFLILPRYGTDLDTVFVSKNKKFSFKTVLTVSIQILDILEYLHSKGFVHADIKASNLLLGFGKSMHSHNGGQLRNLNKRIKVISGQMICPKCSQRHLNPVVDCKQNMQMYKRPQSVNQVYLLDYGLASKFVTNDNTHKQFDEDERKAHAGTVLFCSRDAHDGCTSRRSDLENLGYNILYWLTSKLPWEQDVSDPSRVHSQKRAAFSNLDQFLKDVFGGFYPSCIYEYFRYIKNLSFTEEPNYEYCCKLFCKGLIENGFKNDNLLDFDKKVGCDIFKKKLLGKKIKNKNSENIESLNKTLTNKIVCVNRQPFGTNSQNMFMRKPSLRSEDNNRVQLRKKKFNWAEVLSSNPEAILRQNNRVMKMLEKSNERTFNRTRKNTDCSDSSGNEVTVLNMDLNALNPTYAMISVVNRIREKMNEGGNVLVATSHKSGRGDCLISKHDGYTPAMEMVLLRKRENEERERQELSKYNNCRKTRSTNSVPVKRLTRSGAKRISPARVTESKRSSSVNRKVADSKPIRGLKCHYSLRG